MATLSAHFRRGTACLAAALGVLLAVSAVTAPAATANDVLTSPVAVAETYATPTVPGALVPVTPFRALDTRTSAAVRPDGTVSFQVGGAHGIPAKVSAVTFNLTVTVPRLIGYITAYASGTRRPDASNLNFLAGVVSFVLEHIDIAVVSERFCQQLGKSTGETLNYLRSKNCPVGAVTLGEHGMVWYESGGPDKILPSLSVPLDKVVDSNGAGDVFHGAYIASYLHWPEHSWDAHFRFARGASTHAIQHLGNEASLPSMEDVERANSTFPEKAAA